MAVKQNNGDSGSSKSDENRPDNEASSALQSCTIHDILEIIDSLQSEEQRNRLRCCIVFMLAKVHMPSSPPEIKQFKQFKVRIQQFLPGENSKYHSNYLQTVYRLITGEGKPSPAIAIVFQLFSENEIGAALSLILTNSNTTATEPEIRRGVNVLCSWLRIYSFFENLNLWILAILNGLREQKKYNLIYLIAIDNIELFFKSLIIPVLRSQITPVLHYLISTTEHIGIELHEIINRCSEIFKQLKKHVKESEDPSEILQSLLDLIATIVNNVEASKYVTDIPPAPPLNHTNPKVGLDNLGNTCYMNSIIQAIFRTKEFSLEMLLLENQSADLCRLQELIAVLRHSIRPSFKPTLALNSTRPKEFQAGHQQDSSEFLGHVLEFMHDEEISRKLGRRSTGNDREYINLNSNMKTIVDRNFGGKIQTSIKCLSCENISTNDAAFRDLPLSFPEDADSNTNYTVQSLIEYYFSIENLEGENQYFCEKCKCKNDAEKSLCVLQPPRNLIITLKHFKYDQYTHARKKLMFTVFHNESITLQLCSSDAKEEYSLYAVVVHSGTTSDSGHYFTYAKDDGQWYKFNDNVVILASIPEIHALAPPDTPYILFYNQTSSPNVANNENLNLSTDEYLPTRLKEFLAQDNSRYMDEEDKKRRSQASVIKQIDRKNNRKNNGDKDDDPPSSSCGGNQIQYNNNYVY